MQKTCEFRINRTQNLHLRFKPGRERDIAGRTSTLVAAVGDSGMRTRDKIPAGWSLVPEDASEVAPR